MLLDRVFAPMLGSSPASRKGAELEFALIMGAFVNRRSIGFRRGAPLTPRATGGRL